MWRYRSLLVVVVVFGSFWARSAQAQIKDGFALNRFDPSERGSDWFSGDSLDIRGDVRGGLGIVGDYAHRPLVLYQDGKDSETIIRHQLITHVGGTVILWNRLRLGLNFPLLLLNSGDDVRIDGTVYTAARGVKPGDLRVGADVRLVGEYREPFSLVIGVKAHLPTGSKNAYASDGKVRIEPRILAAGDIEPFVYAARISFIYRALHGTVTGDPFGNELGFGVSAGVRIFDKVLVIGPELIAATVVQKSSAVFDKRTTPLELLFSGKFRIAETFIGGLGIGPGLTTGYGAPALRLLASFEWFPDVKKPEPVPEPKDRDGDGIEDNQDACPDEPGVASGDPVTNGCPAPKDRDNDRIIDEQDACPDEPGIKNDDPLKNGCPAPKDRDNDRIIDEQDACPDEPGIKSDDPKKNGCPAPTDKDGDGITDEQDACPNDPGKANDNPKKNGCPAVVVTEKEIVVNERIEFDTGKATLRPESDTILTSVLNVIQAHPEITKLSVDGHTDNVGAPKFNLKLSQRRAAAVVKWLVSHGVDKARLRSDGFGQDKPLDDNNTESGRQNNRRVEFRIMKE